VRTLATNPPQYLSQNVWGKVTRVIEFSLARATSTNMLDTYPRLKATIEWTPPTSTMIGFLSAILTERGLPRPRLNDRTRTLTHSVATLDRSNSQRGTHAGYLLVESTLDGGIERNRRVALTNTPDGSFGKDLTSSPLTASAGNPHKLHKDHTSHAPTR